MLATELEILMIRPPDLRRFAASRKPLKVPLRLTEIWRSKLLIADVGDRFADHDARIVDQNIHAAEINVSPIEQGRKRAGISHICIDGKRRPTLSLDS